MGQHRTQEWIEPIGGSTGYGCGLGVSGKLNTDGSGYGRGLAHALGIWSNLGNGYGFGCYTGHADQYGPGFAEGTGSGDRGNGEGAGEGYSGPIGLGTGIDEFEGHPVEIVDGVPTAIVSIHGDVAKGFFISENMTEIPCFVVRVGRHCAHAATVHEAYSEAMAKMECDRPIGDRIRDVIAEHPNPDVPIPNSVLFGIHGTITCSCRLGRRQFCEEYGIDVENGSMTMREFISLTESEYGGDHIRLLAEAYGIKDESLWKGRQ